MNPNVRFVQRSLVLAAMFFGIELIISGGRRSLPEAIATSLIWGLLMQTFSDRRDRRVREGKPPYSPWFYYAFGVIGLGASIAAWLTLTERPTGWGFIGLLAFATFCVYMMFCGFQVAKSLSAPGPQTPAG